MHHRYVCRIRFRKLKVELMEFLNSKQIQYHVSDKGVGWSFEIECNRSIASQIDAWITERESEVI